MTDVHDKVAFITGGASGIGLGIAKCLGRAGARLVIADVEAPALERARGELAQLELEALTVQVDVSDRDAMAAARDRVLGQLGAVHLLFNNAGVNVPGAFDSVSYADWDWVLGVNLGGVINGVMTFLPELQRHGPEAHIVNTASVGGLVGMPNLGIYNTTKFAVVGLSEALRADMREHGVGVSVLCPGIVATALGASARNRPERFGGAPLDPSSASAPPIGTSPEALGAQVLDGVRNNAFFICTHPEFRDIVAERNAALHAAFDGAGSTDDVAAMRRLVVPF